MNRPSGVVDKSDRGKRKGNRIIRLFTFLLLLFASLVMIGVIYIGIACTDDDNAFVGFGNGLKEYYYSIVPPCSANAQIIDASNKFCKKYGLACLGTPAVRSFRISPNLCGGSRIFIPYQKIVSYSSADVTVVCGDEWISEYITKGKFNDIGVEQLLSEAQGYYQKRVMKLFQKSNYNSEQINSIEPDNGMASNMIDSAISIAIERHNRIFTSSPLNSCSITGGYKNMGNGTLLVYSRSFRNEEESTAAAFSLTDYTGSQLLGYRSTRLDNWCNGNKLPDEIKGLKPIETAIANGYKVLNSFSDGDVIQKGLFALKTIDLVKHGTSYLWQMEFADPQTSSTKLVTINADQIAIE